MEESDSHAASLTLHTQPHTMSFNPTAPTIRNRPYATACLLCFALPAAYCMRANPFLCRKRPLSTLYNHNQPKPLTQAQLLSGAQAARAPKPVRQSPTSSMPPLLTKPVPVPQLARTAAAFGSAAEPKRRSSKRGRRGITTELYLHHVKLHTQPHTTSCPLTAPTISTSSTSAASPRPMRRDRERAGVCVLGGEVGGGGGGVGGRVGGRERERKGGRGEERLCVCV